MAYNITVRQISRQDPWLSERYDIAAKAEHPLAETRCGACFRHCWPSVSNSLFTGKPDRSLYMHWLSEKAGQNSTQRPISGRGYQPSDPTGAGGTELKSGHLGFKDESMSDFAWALSRMVATGDRVVLDNTELNGTYDFELTFEPPRGHPAQKHPAQRQASRLLRSLRPCRSNSD